MSKEIRKIPKKNYIIVEIICATTILFLGYFTFWYKGVQDYYKNNSVMSGYLSEVQEEGIIENLTNYLIDNPTTILYVSLGNDSLVKDFENQFKTLISKNNIKSNFIYIDLNSISDKKFLLKIKDTFFSEELKNKNVTLEKQSNIFIFEKGKIVDILYGTHQTINLNDVKSFLMRHGVIESD